MAKLRKKFFFGRQINSDRFVIDYIGTMACFNRVPHKSSLAKYMEVESKSESIHDDRTCDIKISA